MLLIFLAPTSGFVLVVTSIVLPAGNPPAATGTGASASSGAAGGGGQGLIASVVSGK